MASIAQVTIDLAANSARMVSELQTANRSFGRFESSVSKSAKRMKTILATVFAGLTGAAFKSFIQDTIDAGDRIQKLSIRLGISTEALTELKHAATLSGVEFNQLTTGLQRMVRRVSEAAGGTGAAVKALDELGISAKKLNQLKPGDQISLLSEALSKVPKQADKVRLAMALLDTGGVPFLQMMTDGAAGLKKMRDEAVKLGQSLSMDQVTAMADANDAMYRLGLVSTEVGNIMATWLAPKIKDVADALQVTVPGAVESAINQFNSLKIKLNELAQTLVKTYREGYRLAQELPGVAGEYYQGLERKSNEYLLTLKKSGIALKEQAAADKKIFSDREKALNAKLSADNAPKLTSVKGRTLSNVAGGVGENEEKKRLQKLESQAKRVYEITRTNAEKIEIEYRKISNLFDEGLIDSETFVRASNRISEQFGEDTDKMKQFGEQAAQSLQSNFAEFLFDPFENGLSGLAKNFSDTMRRMVAELAASQLMNLIGGSLAASGNPALAAAGAFFQGGFASGGKYVGGKAMLVGERGPELMVPNSGGTIIPNGAGGGVVVNQVFDFKGAGQGTPALLRAEANRIKNETLGAVRSEIAGGGSLARLVGRRI